MFTHAFEAKWNLVAEEVSAAASKQIVEEDDESQSQNNIPMEDGHIYEAVDENSSKLLGLAGSIHS